MGLKGSLTGSADKSAAVTESWTSPKLVIPVTGTFQFESGSMITQDAAGYLSHVLAVKDEDMIVQLLPTGSMLMTVKEADGNPSVTGVSVITVSNGTLTDNGEGAVTITTGGGGGGGAPTDAQYVVLAADGDLSAERVLTAGTGITLTDAGANGAITVAATNNGDVTMASNTTTDNVVVTTNSTGGKAIQQANATTTTGGQSLHINADNKSLILGANTDFTITHDGEHTTLLPLVDGDLILTGSASSTTTRVTISGSTRIAIPHGRTDAFVLHMADGDHPQSQYGMGDIIKVSTADNNEWIQFSKEAAMMGGGSVSSQYYPSATWQNGLYILQENNDPASANTPILYTEPGTNGSNSLVISGSAGKAGGDATKPSVTISGSLVSVVGKLSVEKDEDNTTDSGCLFVADDITVGDNLLLNSESALIQFGDTSSTDEIHLIHNPGLGLLLKNTKTGDSAPISLTLQTAEAEMEIDEAIGKIDFQAPNESGGTDAILVAAGIEAIAESDFSASSNSTKLSFKVAKSETASEKAYLSGRWGGTFVSKFAININGDPSDQTHSIWFGGSSQSMTPALTVSASAGAAAFGPVLVVSGSSMKTEGAWMHEGPLGFTDSFGTGSATNFAKFPMAGMGGGEAIRIGQAAIAINPGTLVVLNHDQAWDYADATGVESGSSGLIGVCLGKIDTSNGNIVAFGAGDNISTYPSKGILLSGIVRVARGYVNNIPSRPIGKPVYISHDTQGYWDFSTTTTSDEYVRLVGHCIGNIGSGDFLMHFNPDKIWLQLD